MRQRSPSPDGQGERPELMATLLPAHGQTCQHRIYWCECHISVVSANAGHLS
jgi:hypothetical protein